MRVICTVHVCIRFVCGFVCLPCMFGDVDMRIDYSNTNFDETKINRLNFYSLGLKCVLSSTFVTGSLYTSIPNQETAEYPGLLLPFFMMICSSCVEYLSSWAMNLACKGTAVTRRNSALICRMNKQCTVFELKNNLYRQETAYLFHLEPHSFPIPIP